MNVVQNLGLGAPDIRSRMGARQGCTGPLLFATLRGSNRIRGVLRERKWSFFDHETVSKLGILELGSSKLTDVYRRHLSLLVVFL